MFTSFQKDDFVIFGFHYCTNPQSIWHVRMRVSEVFHAELQNVFGVGWPIGADEIFVTCDTKLKDNETIFFIGAIYPKFCSIPKFRVFAHPVFPSCVDVIFQAIWHGFSVVGWTQYYS